jgi:hypothetical protein
MSERASSGFSSPFSSRFSAVPWGLRPTAVSEEAA